VNTALPVSYNAYRSPTTFFVYRKLRHNWRLLRRSRKPFCFARKGVEAFSRPSIMSKKSLISPLTGIWRASEVSDRFDTNQRHLWHESAKFLGTFVTPFINAIKGMAKVWQRRSLLMITIFDLSQSLRFTPHFLRALNASCVLYNRTEHSRGLFIC